jgi:hypothetical protein
MITIAHARTLFGEYRRQVPELAGVFVRALRLPAAERPAWLAAAYNSLTPVDFSRDLMATTTGLTAYVWPSSVRWVDLGTPARLLRWLESARASSPAVARPPVHAASPGRLFTTPVCRPRQAGEGRPPCARELPVAY